MNITGVILAGGENKRFLGKTKAKIRLGGKPMIENTIEILQNVFNDILIITNKPEELSDYRHIRMLGDIYKKIGPLGGIHSALHATNADAIFVVASDMPYLSEDLIRLMTDHYLQSDYEVLIPSLGDFNEPLHAIYSMSVYERLDNFLRETKKYAIKEFLSLNRVEYLSMNDLGSVSRAFTNINTPEDLINLKRP